jgi:RNA polymerase sigma-70 factor (ECF subfamily)
MPLSYSKGLFLLMKESELIPHLFRTEYSKIVAVLCRRFGFNEVETAEDIASDTFLTAAHTWGLNGTPQNPVAWLYMAAKNRAKNYLKRQSTFENKILGEIRNNTSCSYYEEIDLTPQNIEDSQLQMMFAICHPAISVAAQIALSLRFLCGFGIEEIANAFLTNKETISKRLFRAKEKLREIGVKIEMPDPRGMDERIDTVLTTIYLLFNEGYYSVSQDKVLRNELCLEAIRLCNMLIENKLTNRPQAYALLALMCFHSSRFEARLDANGEQILYDDQNIELWDADLISKGGYFLNKAATGDKISKYHLQAGIAYWNTQKKDTPDKWENILQYYNKLLQLEYSPITALNRAYALSKANGKQAAIAEAEKLELFDSPFYFILLGELYTDIDNSTALGHYQKAVSLIKTKTARQSVQNKIDKLKG